MVIAFHYTSALAGVETLGLFGKAGVRLFFALSGFLITGILLRAQGGGVRAFGRFYARRARRIFPIYYLTLGVAVLLALPGAESWPWAAAYALNLRLALTGTSAGVIEHFWSLAVEEQFYLVWPLLVLLLPLRVLPWLVVTMIVTGPAFRLWCVLTEQPLQMLWYATPASVDSLGAGCAAALVYAGVVQVRGLRLALGMGGALAACYFSLGPLGALTRWGWLALDAALSLWLGVLVLHTARGWGAWMLAAAPLRYVGRISYGLYLYHPLVLYGVALTAMSAGMRATVAVFGVLAIAVASWRWIERPLLAHSGDDLPHVATGEDIEGARAAGLRAVGHLQDERP